MILVDNEQFQFFFVCFLPVSSILHGLYPIPGACEMADPLTDSWQQCVECDFSGQVLLSHPQG